MPLKSSNNKHGTRSYIFVGLVILITITGLVLLHFTGVFPPRWSSQYPPLRIGYQSSPPYQLLGPNNEPKGVGIDLIKTAASNLGIELQWIYSPDSPDQSFAQNKVDLWPIVTDIPYRHNEFHISKPIYQNSLGMLTRENSPIRKPTDTSGKRVAFYNREPGITYVRQLFPKAELLPMPGNVETIKSVFNGEADAAFLWSTKANSISFKTAVDEHPDIPFKFYFFHDAKITCGIAGSLTTPHAALAADLLREEIRKLATNGKAQEIYFKYYLDPENEISSYFYIYNLQERNFLLTLSVSLILLALLVMVVMAVQLQRSSKAAFAASESKSMFLANMSHEIRTPLNGMVTMTELALCTDLNAEQRHLIKIAHESADSLLTIVNDILDFSKIEASRLKIVYQSASVNELLFSCVKFFEPSAHQREIQLNYNVTPDCPEYILVDTIRLRQILSNLIGNAVKYTHDGSINVVASTRTQEGNKLIVFEVIDTGIGIPESKQKRIFEAFEQADTSTTRKYGGSGLGLTICRNLVQLMDGRIELESQEGKGSTFRILLPLKLGVSPKPKVVLDSPIGIAPTTAPSWHILLVDDNPINLKIAGTVLQRHSHTFETAENGLIAVEKAKNNHYDLILMDIQMPDMDGYEATRVIRKWELSQGHYTPIIALTACVLNNEERLCKQAGMDAFLSKPLRVKDLIAKLDTIILNKNTISS